MKMRRTEIGASHFRGATAASPRIGGRLDAVRQTSSGSPRWTTAGTPASFVLPVQRGMRRGSCPRAPRTEEPSTPTPADDDRCPCRAGHSYRVWTPTNRNCSSERPRAPGNSARSIHPRRRRLAQGGRGDLRVVSAYLATAHRLGNGARGGATLGAARVPAPCLERLDVTCEHGRQGRQSGHLEKAQRGLSGPIDQLRHPFCLRPSHRSLPTRVTCTVRSSLYDRND